MSASRVYRCPRPAGEGGAFRGPSAPQGRAGVGRDGAMPIRAHGRAPHCEGPLLTGCRPGSRPGGRRQRASDAQAPRCLPRLPCLTGNRRGTGPPRPPA